MRKFKETEIKYLAGLFDADGSLSIKFTKGETGKIYFHLLLELSAAKTYDKHGYLPSLTEVMGSCSTKTYDNPNWSDAYVYRIQARSELNQILPRLIKHMVIKGTHWNNLFNLYTELKGQELTTEDVAKYKEYSKSSRKIAQPLKPKKHPTWAWVAGYLDGDGSYQLPKRGGSAIQVKAHDDDVVGIELLRKAFGGGIIKVKGENTHCWYRSLGKQSRSFAIPFLRKVHRHSQLKKWKIEQILNYHSGRND